MKRLLVGLGLVLLLAVGGFFAVGGKQGVLLLFAKYVIHKEAAPNQPVTWQAGPASAPAEGKRAPNILLIVADDLG